MRRFTVLGICLVVVACFTATTAFAQSPHFISSDSNATINSACELVVSWKEAGLGSNENISYDAAATNSSAVYACINNGGKHPSTSNKDTVGGQVDRTGTLSSGK